MRYSNTTILPHNFLAEQAILNILLTDPIVLKDILLDLKAEHFYFAPHKIIYETMVELWEEKYPINITSVITRLQDQNKFKESGGIERIENLISRFENLSELDDYVRMVRDKYIRRLIIEIGKQTILLGYTTSEDLDTILNKMEHSIFSLTEQNSSQKIYSSSEIIEEVFQEMQSKIKRTILTGLKSSFHDLDAILQGIQKSDLVIVAGRPSMGKTAFALNLGINIVKTYKAPLLIFTLEMSRQQIVYRFLSSLSSIHGNRLKSGKMNSLEWKALGDAMKEFSTLPIYVDDNPNLTLVEIRAKMQKIFSKEEKNKPGIVIIDYLQLMKLNLKLENRVQEISYITRNLKILSKEFQVPIILLSQLSRSVESRTNKRPMLSDLRESGCVATLTKPKASFAGETTLENSRSIRSWSKKSIVNPQTLNFDFKGVKPTFVVTFANGVMISLTSNHRILAKEGWIRVFQLKPNTEIYSVVQKRTEKKVLEYGYHAITSIEYDGLHAVYDKTISYFHNYVVEDILLHNSIEQDADIVIMLYREEYYTKPSMVEEQQVTEFIVAKHRNGPIGTAKLFFHPATTTFKNL